MTSMKTAARSTKTTTFKVNQLSTATPEAVQNSHSWEQALEMLSLHGLVVPVSRSSFGGMISIHIIPHV